MQSQREIAYLLLDANDVDTARQEIDSIVNVFVGTNNLPAELYNIALRLGQKKLTSDAIKLHQYNSNTFPKEAAAMRSQAQVVQLNIKDGNNPGADAAYTRLLDIFAKQSTLPDEIYRTADVYIDVNNFDKAAQLEQTVISKWPKTNSAMNAQLGFVKIHFAKDDLPNANTAIDTLIADYNDNTQLPRVILMFGEGYYKKGLVIHQGKTPPGSPGNPILESTRQTSKNNFNKSQALWLKTIAAVEANSVKADYSMTAEYYHYAGTINRELGNYEKAIEYYTKVVENWPKYEASWSVQAMIPQAYERMKNEGLLSADQADPLIIEGYQKVIERYPDSPAARAAQNKLKRYQEPVQINRGTSRPTSNRGGVQ